MNFGRVMMGAALAAAAIVLGGPAQAQMVSATQPDAIVDVLKSEDLPAKLIVDKDDGPYIESNYHKMKFLVFFFNCDDDNHNCKTIQFYMGFLDAKETTLEQLNEWNKTRRFGRAYRDKSGDPVLEMDLDLDFEGLPRENVVESLHTWLALMDAYRAHLFDK